MGFVVVALVCVGCGESEVPATVPAMEIVEYTVLDDALDESPGKTQVTMDLLVEGTATESELRDVLHAVYDEVNGRAGFQYHATPRQRSSPCISIRVAPMRPREWDSELRCS